MPLKLFCDGKMGKNMRTCFARILPLRIDVPEMTRIHEVIKSRCRWMEEWVRRGEKQIPQCFSPIMCLSVEKDQLS